MKKILIGMFVITILLMLIPTDCFAYSGIDTNISIGGTEAAKSSAEITGRIVGVLQTAGSIISVIAIIIIGMRYMFSSVEDKASMKGVMGYYVVGCVLVFATSNVLAFAYDIINDVEHTYVAISDEKNKAATCSATGLQVYECNGSGGLCDCTPGKGKRYEETLPINPSAHNKCDEWKTSIASTCTAEGTKIKDCIYCHVTMETGKIAVLGHEFTNDSYILERYQAATCSHPDQYLKKCTRCDIPVDQVDRSERPASIWAVPAGSTCKYAFTNHCYQRDTDNDNKPDVFYSKCDWCGHPFETEFKIVNGKIEKVAVDLKHTYGDWTVTMEATCTTEGEKQHRCTENGGNCPGVETQKIAAVGHAWETDWFYVLQPTCTNEGQERRLCTIPGCDGYEQRTVAAVGHSLYNVAAIAPTCTTVGSTAGERCRNCEYISGATTIPKLEHNFVADNTRIALTATCNSPARYWKKCNAGCGKVYNEIYTIGPYSYNDTETVAYGRPLPHNRYVLQLKEILSAKHTLVYFCYDCGEELERTNGTCDTAGDYGTCSGCGFYHAFGRKSWTFTTQVTREEVTYSL